MLSLRAYIGRWVAIVRGQIAGVGLTADDARLAAQLNRPREKPQVLLVAEFSAELPAFLNTVRDALPKHQTVWLVGGVVRDALLNRRLKDFDFVVEGDGLTTARTVANTLGGAYYPLDAERGVGRVLITQEDQTLTLDFARLRGLDLAADLAARDFTLNALAVPLAETNVLIDPLGGENDLRAKIIRLCTPNAISDDPLRAVRAVRLAAQLNFKLDAEVRAAIRTAGPQLAQVSAERQRDEFMRCMAGPKAATALRVLDALGLLEILVPELATLKGVTQSPPHVFDVWEHTLAVVQRLEEIIHILGPVHDVDAASDLILGLMSVQLGRYRHALSEHLNMPLAGDRPVRWTLMLAALLHDAAKPSTRTIDSAGRIRFFGHEERGEILTGGRLTALRLSNDEIQRARLIVANHMRPRQLSQKPPISRRAIYRYYREAGPAGVDIILLSLADFLAKRDGPPPQDEWALHLKGCAQLLEAYFEKREESVAPKALLNGDEVMQTFGLPPGPRIGQVLDAVREAQATGEVTDHASAVEFVRRWLSEQNS